MGNFMVKQKKALFNGCHQFPRPENFRFLEPFVLDTDNGLFLNDFYFPEELFLLIFSKIEPEQLLELSLVCKKWFNIIKSDLLWREIYCSRTKRTPKKLPWFCYYSYLTTDNFKNMIKNGNGQDNLEHWDVLRNYGDGFVVEKPPHGCEPLDLSIPEFNNQQSCFVTSYYECTKVQGISLKDKRLLQYIIQNHKPVIYISEWIAARFDCGCDYKLIFKCSDEEDYEPHYPNLEDKGCLFIHKRIVNEKERSKWVKIEASTTDYSSDLKTLIFLHEGKDTQFWKGHYGAKMAGAVVRFEFDSLQVNL